VVALMLTDLAPMGTAFSYQGRLEDSSSPANGTYDFEFLLFDAVCMHSLRASTTDNP